MRVAKIVSVAVATVVLAGVIVLELFAPALATRAARDAVERCFPVDELQVVSLGRPATLGVLRGQVRDVRVTAIGLQVGELRVDHVDARLPAFPVGWGSADGSTTLVADVRLTEGALTDYLDAVAPEFARPLLTIDPDGIEVGDQRVPFGLELRARLVENGIQLVPIAGDPFLWESLGLQLHLEVPPPIELLTLDLGDGEVLLTARARVNAGGGGGGGGGGETACPDPDVWSA